MTEFCYEIRKLSGSCSGSAWAILTINQAYCDSVYPTNNYRSAFETTEFINYPPKRGYTTCRTEAKGFLSPMGSNTPSNTCVKKVVYNTDTNGLVITYDGTNYLLPSGEKIGTTLPDYLEPFYATEKHSKPARPNYFEQFNSKNLSYQSKRKRKRARQSFTY